MRMMRCFLVCLVMGMFGGVAFGEKKVVTTFIVEIIPNEDDFGNVIAVDARGRELLMQQIGKRLSGNDSPAIEITLLKNGNLSVEVEATDKVEIHILNVLKSSGKMTIHAVHPNGINTKLAKEVFDGDGIVPGYKAFIDEVEGENGKMDKRYYLVRRKAGVSGNDVEAAFPDMLQRGLLNITLTVKGGEKMKEFTQGLKQGDMLVTIVDGIVVSAATLNAPWLGRHFQISGQKDLEESKLLAESILSKFEYQLKVTEVLKR